MVVAQPLTLEQFLAQEETEPASEFVCGEVIQKPMPTNLHAILQFHLTTLIDQFLLQTKLGIVLLEWRCIFGRRGRERAFVPDIAFATAEHYASGLDADGYLRRAPDLAIEVLSPGQENTTRFSSKVDFYLKHGVRLLWVVDPRARTIQVFSPQDDDRLLSGDDVLDGGDVLPGFAVTVAQVFSRLPEV